MERGELSGVVTNSQLTIAQFSDRSRSARLGPCLLIAHCHAPLVWKQSAFPSCLRQSIRQSQTMTLIKTVTHSVDNYHSSSRRDSHCRRCLRRCIVSSFFVLTDASKRDSPAVSELAACFVRKAVPEGFAIEEAGSPAVIFFIGD